MVDISVIWSPPNSRADWAMAGADLLTGDDLASAVLISLFSDRLADPDDVIPDGTGDPRGWAGDTPQDRFGSKLWLRVRSKQTSATLNAIRGDMVAALKWMIEDGVAAAVDVLCEWEVPGRLAALVTVRRKDGTTTSLKYAWAWEGIA